MGKLNSTARRAAEIIRFTPGITRIDLAQALGISAPTANPLVSDLLAQGLVAEHDLPRPAGAKGRPRTGLVCLGKRDTVGVLVWGHGMFDIALLGYDQTVIWRQTTPVGSRRTEADIVSAALDLFDAAGMDTTLAAPSALVLALPAPYESGVGVAGGVGAADAAATFASWFEGDPLAMLTERFAIPVIVDNDANLGALGEAKAGAAHGLNCAVYLKLSGHGIGSGIIIDGEVFEGSHGFAGEIAHVRVDDDSQILCVCGSRGCLEEKLGPALLRPFQITYGADRTWADLLEMVERDAPGPLRILQDAGRTAGRALADVSTFLNPDAIILDAGSPSASAAVLRGVAEQIEQSAPPFIRHGLELKVTALGDAAPLIGSVEIARLVQTGRHAPGRRRLRVFRSPIGRNSSA